MKLITKVFDDRGNIASPRGGVATSLYMDTENNILASSWQRLLGQDKYQGIIRMGKEELNRSLAKVEGFGGEHYYADLVTGSLYQANTGRCLSSNALTLSGKTQIQGKVCRNDLFFKKQSSYHDDV